MAMLLLPASSATTGVIQHSEAARADNSPAPVNEPCVLILIMLMEVYALEGKTSIIRIFSNGKFCPQDSLTEYKRNTRGKMMKGTIGIRLR